MKVDVLCNDENHPVNAWLTGWIKNQKEITSVIIRSKKYIRSGDILFLVSCTEIIPNEIRSLYRHTIVLHASNLPDGRGWSPHIWSILQGETRITVSAIDAEDQVDSGDVWAQLHFDVAPDELYDEINASLFSAELELMDRVVEMVRRGDKPRPQGEGPCRYFPRRTPADSEIDPHQSVAAQFDKIRVCDPARYPAFFRLHGHTYKISLTRISPMTVNMSGD